MANFTSSRDKNQLLPTGIILLVLSFFITVVVCFYTVRTVIYAKNYRTDVTGTVTDCSVIYELDDHNDRVAYSNVTICYETPQGRTLKIERKHLYGEYCEGQQIALRCSEDYMDAVLESETHRDPLFLIAMFVLAVFFGVPGALLVKGKYRH